MIKEVQIFYFSGTGNARKIVYWFTEYAFNKGAACEIFDIAKINSGFKVNSDVLIIIISPIHGFNFPKITLDFLRNFPKGKNQIVLMNTRAGARIGKFVTPGLTGIAFILASIILKLKGYKIVGQIPFDMPSNWISIHPALKEKSIKILHKKNYEKVIKHAGKILAGENDFTALKDIIQDILIAPISILYYLIGRFVFAKTFYASFKCDNCGLCIKECPVHAIKNINDKPFWTLNCESCMKCMNNCPKRAIETAHGLILVVIILSIAISSIIPLDIWGNTQIGGFANFIIKNVIVFLLLLVLYKIHHILNNNKNISRFILYFSLTYYKFWGRYKALSDYKWKNNS